MTAPTDAPAVPASSSPLPPPDLVGPGGSGRVLGDGTTVRSRARTRWERARWPLAVLVGLLLLGAVTALLRPTTSDVPFAPDNPEERGGRAVAQILAEQGVTVEYVRSSADAVAAATPDSTLLVVGSYVLTDDQVDAITDAEGDLVLVGVESWHLSRLTDGALEGGYGESTGTAPQAACDDPDARAAGSVTSRGRGITAVDPAATVCFPSDPADPSTGAYAVLDGERRVAALDDVTLLTNERLTEDGTAALVLRALGEREHLVWYVPSFDDVGLTDDGAPTGSLLPPWVSVLGLQLLVLVVALALWRGRALGRVVAEPLPVTVRAAETTLGRGRLYRRSRSRGHAAAALRAGTARRAAARVGVARTAGAPEVIDALARATGRSTEQVAGLLYGPPPTDDAGLLQLARHLDELESEVHRT